MKKFIATLSAVVLCCSYSPVYTNAVEYAYVTDDITVENSPELWERFLKYDLCITDYDSLTSEKKDLCRFIFETELNSEDTIICERARRILGGYDVGRRVTLEDTEIYYDIIDYNFLYNYFTEEYHYERPCLYAVPDIKHVDGNVDYNEYWLDDNRNEAIISQGENLNTGFSSYELHYTYLCDLNDHDYNYHYGLDIPRPDVNFEIITDETFTYAVCPDNTLYVMNPNEHLTSYEVPEEVNGMKVVGIKEYAFKNEDCRNITLPESIKYIEPLAFAECTYLEDINLPKNLQFIGIDSFTKCTSLKNITIDCPDLLCISRIFDYCDMENVFLNSKTIHSNMLKSFENIDNLTLGNDVVQIGILFANSKFMEEYNYTIPETVNTIRDDCRFYNDYYKEDLVVPETVDIFLAYAGPATGSIRTNLSFVDSVISVIDNKCFLSPDTVISGYYGSDAHKYSIANNLIFNPLDDLNYGDANNDGNINIADAVSLQKYLFGNGTVGYEADLNKDGTIDSFDMIPMRKTILNPQ